MGNNQTTKTTDSQNVDSCADERKLLIVSQTKQTSNQHSPQKYLSLFSGVGGFEYGIRKATNNQWECVGFSEIDKHSTLIYKKHFPTHRELGDITKINVNELLPLL